MPGIQPTQSAAAPDQPVAPMRARAPDFGDVITAQSVFNNTFDVGRKIYETGEDISNAWGDITQGQSADEMLNPHNPNSAVLGQHIPMFDQSSLVGTDLEPYADRFKGMSAVEGETQRKRLQKEVDNNTIIERAPWYETVAGGAVQTALDPMTYLFAPEKIAATVPFLKRTAQTAFAYGKSGVAAETVGAGIRQATTQTRTWQDEATSIALGGIVGSLVGGLAPSIGKARSAMADYWSTRSHLTGFSPTGRLAASPLATSRGTLDALVEHGLETGNQARPNVETTIRYGTDAEMGKFTRGLREDFLAQDTGPWITRGRRFNQYLEDVGVEARKPTPPDPRLAASVDRWRAIATARGAELTDPLLHPNQAAPLYPALRPNYVPQRWQTDLIRDDPKGFDQFLQTQGLTAQQAQEARLQLTQKPGNTWGNIPKGGPLHQRMLNVDPVAAAPWLENNIHTLADKYLSTVVPRIELTREFGHYDMGDAIQKIRDEALASGSTRKMDRAEADIADVELVRNRLLNVPTGTQSPESLLLLGRILRNEAAASQLGSASWSSLQELATPILKYGATNYVLGLKRMFTGWGATRTQMRDLGLAADNVLSRWQGISTDSAASKLERFTRFGATAVNKLSGLEALTNVQRQLNYAVAEQALLRSDLKRIAGAGAKDPVEILHQMQAHAANGELNLDQWTSPAAVDDALKLLSSEVRRGVVSPGAGDLPRFMTENEMGRYVTQFTSFMYAYWYRVVRPAVQTVTQGTNRLEGISRMTQGTFSILALGYLAQTARAYTAGRDKEWNALGGPEQIAQVLNNVGVTGPIMDILNKADMAAGYPMPIPGNFKYKFGSQWQVAGPAISQVSDLAGAAGNAMMGKPDPNAARKVRRALPLQNLWWARRAFDAMWPETKSGVPTHVAKQTHRTQI